MSQISQHIGSRIRSFRRAQGMTLQQLADKIHKSRASVSKYETGEITVDIETLFEIAEALGVELSQLTGAVSSLSLTVAGIITAVILSFLAQFI